MNKDNTETKLHNHPPCDFCKNEDMVIRQATFDARIEGTFTWAFMCAHHFALYGHGLGLGHGQALV